MGLMANSVSIYQYQVKGTAPDTIKLDEWVRECLARNAFQPIDQTADEESVGWVNFYNPMDYEFEDVFAFKNEQYFALALRRDQRKVPGALLKNMLSQECDQWLSVRPQLNRVPVKARIEMRENLNAALLSRTLPIPQTWDMIWNTEQNILTVSNISQKVLDLIEDKFQETFDGLRLVPIHPMARAKRVLNEEQNQALSRLNNSSSQDVLEQINANKWMGWDFLLWLMYQTANGSSEYCVTQEGPLEMEEPFISFIHDRFILSNEQEEGIRKSSIIGPQDNFAEAREAIQSGKNITEGIIYFERGEDQWKLTLKADIFAFGSLKSPKVQLEQDEATSPIEERQAVFYERMYLLETATQLFDSLLQAFLLDRIQGRWPEFNSKINQWLVS